MHPPSVPWEDTLAPDLRDPEFARGFLIACIDDGVTLQFALDLVIRLLGAKKFADKVGMALPNLLRVLNPRHNPTQATFDRLLKPFGLRLGLAPIAKPEKKRVAKARTAPNTKSANAKAVGARKAVTRKKVGRPGKTRRVA